MAHPHIHTVIHVYKKVLFFGKNMTNIKIVRFKEIFEAQKSELNTTKINLSLTISI